MWTAKRIAKATASRLSRSWTLVRSTIGPNNCYCNCCRKHVAEFYLYGGRPFGCPRCRSSNRERFVTYCLDSHRLRIPAIEGGLLHVAPSEKSLIERFQVHEGYQPVDLFPDLYRHVATQKMDLMAMQETETYRLVYLSHVMEHVPDDVLVLKNLYRSLKPGGEGWFLIPMKDQKTQDGTAEMTAKDRERVFGQWDHARQYGPDFEDRLRGAGFEVEVLKPGSVPTNESRQLGLQRNDWIFVARKTG